MIRSIAAKGIHGRLTYDGLLHPDINILTGRNGSGKTTLLKSIWYLTCGRIDLLIREVAFESFRIDTDTYAISVHREEETCKIILQIGNEDEKIFNNPYERLLEPTPAAHRLRVALSNAIGQGKGRTIFFPTFRRIEGGFSVVDEGESPLFRVTGRRRVGFIQEAFSHISDEMSTESHLFVSSISTRDITELFTRKFAELSERGNVLQNELSEKIIDTIRKYSSRHRNSASNAESILKTISEEVLRVQKDKEELFRPLTELSNVAGSVFTDKGIVVTPHIALGLPDHRILSDKLSAGEKQMLSFLAYNALFDGATIFIDEPELSLHVDWQRVLFLTLLRQNPRNQFIVSTHSPFIYSRYSDKEILLSDDRGAADAVANADY